MFMKVKTHLLIGIFAALYFAPFVENKIIFFPIVLIASLIPDIDTIIPVREGSKAAKFFNSRFYQNFMHSYTFCILISLIIALIYPIAAFPFFLGYSFHLLFDSLTITGTTPFWPLKVKSKGPIRLGGRLETIVRGVVVILIFILVVRYVYIALI